jgi:hypothetical protein
MFHDSWSSKHLLDYSGEHIKYEVDMLVSCWKLAFQQQPANETMPGWALRMAKLETTVFHARVLINFLYPAPKDIKAKSDVTANAYFTSPEAWDQFRAEPLPATLQKIRRKASKEVAHLTTDRIAGNERAKHYEQAHFQDLFLELGRFGYYADPSRLHSNALQAIAAAMLCAPSLSTSTGSQGATMAAQFGPSTRFETVHMGSSAFEIARIDYPTEGPTRGTAVYRPPDSR